MGGSRAFVDRKGFTINRSEEMGGALWRAGIGWQCPQGHNCVGTHQRTFGNFSGSRGDSSRSVESWQITLPTPCHDG